MATIGVDARCLMDGKRTGVEEYTLSLIEKLLEKDRENKYIFFINSFKKPKGNFSWLNKYENVEIRNYGFPNKLFNFLIWFFHWPKIDLLLGGVDVFFVPNISFLAVSDSCRLVLTIHDLSFELFPEYYSYKRRLWHFMVNPRVICKRANKIMAVSDSTAQDVRSIYQIPKEKIEVVSSIVELKRFFFSNLTIEKIRKLQEKYKLPLDFILFLGTIEPRKNLINLVKAFELVKMKPGRESIKLVIAGNEGWSCDKILKTIRESPFRNEIILTGSVDDNDKPLIYKMARIFAYPSFYEGYGYPPLEAMASRLPVICSDQSSLPEVVADSAIAVNPYNYKEIHRALELFVKNPQLAEYFAEKGFVRAKKMSKNDLEISFARKIIENE